MKSLCCFIAAVVFSCGSLNASVIAQVGGPTYVGTGIGNGNGQQAAAMGFALYIGAQNVSISAPMSVLLENTPVTAYLSTQIGPGTTQSDVIAKANFVLPPNTSDPNNYQFTNETFFSGLNLPAGNYYLSLVETDGTNEAGAGLVFSGSQTFLFPPGVSGFLGTFGANSQSGTFAPGFSYSNLEQASLFAGDDAFTVTGTLVPEPASAAIIGGMIAACGLRRRTRK
jgi:hypothetical protein